jgi:hypothetical protein
MSVMSALLIDSRLIPAAPLLNDLQLVWIMPEAGCMLMKVKLIHAESAWHSMSAITWQVKTGGVRRSATMCSDITTHSTEAQVSWPLIRKIEGLMR